MRELRNWEGRFGAAGLRPLSTDLPAGTWTAPAGESGLIDLLAWPVDVLGPGRRAGIWFQGCPRRCQGCMSPQSWEFNEDRRVALATVEQKLMTWGLFTDRLTITGGEPLAQPEFLHRVLEAARREGFRDILLYTGFPYASLRRWHPVLLNLVDAVVDGEFRHDQPTSRRWRGSENQRLVVVSDDPDIQTRYSAYIDGVEEAPQTQVYHAGDRSILFGIPRTPGTGLPTDQVPQH